MSASANQATEAASLLRRAFEVLGAAPSTSASSTMSASGPSSGSPTTTTTTGTSAIIQEHRRLFNRQMRMQPYSASRPTGVRGQRGRGSVQKERTITRSFVCLSDREQDRVPSTAEKLRLKNNGLGEKKILLPITADAESVKSVLYEAFTPLKSCGGFELLTMKEKSRTELSIVSYGSCSTEEIRCFGSGRIYIRPVQIDITLNDSNLDWGDQYEDCMICKMPVALSAMRRHMETCGNEDDCDDLPPMLDTQDQQRANTSGETDHQNTGHYSFPTVTESDSGSAGIVLVEDGTSEEAERESGSPGLVPVEDGTSEEAEREEMPFEQHRRKAIEETLTSMSTCNEPVTVLKEYRANFVRGRPLDLESEDTPCEGKTIEIFVSRMNIYKDAMAELVTEPPIEDISFPLEVTFIGEEAADYGGPRKEFLGAVMREVREELFQEAGSQDGEYELTNDVAPLRQHYYYGAGLIFGFSMLQGGPLPCFLKEEQLQTLLNGQYASLRESERQFQSGLAKFGLIELVNKKPCLVFLLRKTAVRPLMYPRVVKLLQARFSEEGSNSRAEEEKVYRTFINYLKEVSAGRRGSVTLAKVIKFVTGSEAEPVLGYGINPHIVFNRYAISCLPTSNTCINKLTLPVGDKVPRNPEKSYEFFDYAFNSDYFGSI